MRSLAVGAALTIGVNGALFPRAKTGDGFISVPVGTVDRPKSSKAKRQDGDAIVFELENRDFFYAAEIAIGTPAQTVTVLVDTGSSELWVNPDCDTAPTSLQERQCNSFGFYNPRDSDTPPIGPFGSEELNYGDPTDPTTQTSVTLRYYTETLGFGDAEITNQTFGVVEESYGISQGILGLAPDLVGGFDEDADPYSLVLNTMAQQGVIASRAFTLDLRHSESSTGAVIYGGLDRNKFIGSLESLPIVRGQRGEYRLAVNLETMGLTLDESQNYELDGDDRNVVLDSGTTLTRMHAQAAMPIYDALGAQPDGEGYYYVDCDLRESAGSVDFGFGDKLIRVPFSDFILDLDAPVCAVGMVITEDQQILGDSVLRAGYFVFDWDNEAIHVAQAANCGDDDIVAIGSGNDAVPDVTGNCDESDGKFTDGGPAPTATGVRTRSAYTTTFTITSCPGFDEACETGAVTTQTIEGAVITGGSDDDNNGGDDDDDNAGLQTLAGLWTLAVCGGAAVVYNLL